MTIAQFVYQKERYAACELLLYTTKLLFITVT